MYRIGLSSGERVFGGMGDDKYAAEGSGLIYLVLFFPLLRLFSFSNGDRNVVQT